MRVRAAIFLAGLVLGGIITAVISSQSLETTSEPAPEVRQGPHGLINPLLECRDGSRLRAAVLPFRRAIDQALDQAVRARRIRRGSVYFRDLIGGPWFAAGSPEPYRIGSLLKVPLLLGYLRRAETEPAVLQKALLYAGPTEPPGSQDIAPSERLVAGRSYTVTELLSRAIVQSDNEAAALLAQDDGGQSLETIGEVADFPPFRDGNLYLTPQHFGSMFRILFNASYLTQAASEQALELLAHTEFLAGLVAGVPAGTVVAHKFGERMDDGVAKLHDCGIVYHPARPYVLCVMTEGDRFESLASLIAEISRVAYDQVGDESARSTREVARPRTTR